MGNGVFITGTDTGVGKTLVACGLACALRDSGRTIGVMKPAETGCGEREGRLFAQDAALLRAASGCEEPLDSICPYRLPLPLAPSVAAEKAGVRIDPSLILSLYHSLSASHDLTLVEGAGGLLVPLLPHYSYADLARSLDLPLIVVVANRLGTLSHALLTLDHASCLGLEVLGYILNDVHGERSPAVDTNPGTLRSLTRVPCLGEIPYLPADPLAGSLTDSHATRLAAVFRDNVNLDLLRHLLLS